LVGEQEDSGKAGISMKETLVRWHGREDSLCGLETSADTTMKILDERTDVVKEVTFTSSSGDQFILLVRRAKESFIFEQRGSSSTLDIELCKLIAEKISASPFPKDRVNEEWRVLVEALQAGGWTPHEVFTSTFHFSFDDPRVVSRLVVPGTPSSEVEDLHRRMHESISGVFSDVAVQAAADIRRFAENGQHLDAFAALSEARARLALIAPPVPDLIEAICMIDESAIPKDSAFDLWTVRIGEKSRARLYAGLEEELQFYEQEFSDRLTPLGEDSNRLLAIRAEIAEHTGKPEVAYARYRELLTRDNLDTVLRAHANWGAFRLSTGDYYIAARHAELAADAFMEAGDRAQAAKCYVCAAKACETLDRAKAIEMLDKALRVLDTSNSLGAEYRAGILHVRAGMMLDWGDCDSAFKAIREAIQIRKTLTGVDDALIASLHLAELVAERKGDEEEVGRLHGEIESLRPRADPETLLRDRLAQCPLSDIGQLRRLHEEVLSKKDPRLTAESLIFLGCAHMKSSLSSALEYFETALNLAQRAARLTRDTNLHALIESSIGQAYFTHGDHNKAIEWFKKAVAHDPREVTARQNLGGLLMKYQRFGELVEFMETQLRIFGDLPVLLYFYGRALLANGRPSAAAKALHHSKTVCKDPDLLKWIEDWIGKALKELQEAVEISTIRPQQLLAVTREEFGAELRSFAGFIKTERRMSFWRTEAGKHRFVAAPEKHAKMILHAFLRGRLGDEVVILEEIVAGAGLIDLWIATPGGSRFVVELKMCGKPYSATYAKAGIEQLAHYMDNKKTHIGYLVVFDSRRRDYGKGIEAEIMAGGNTIMTEFVDIRPDVIGERSGSQSEE
jgi:tetratricopeptide (TPR) repeat protein